MIITMCGDSYIFYQAKKVRQTLRWMLKSHIFAISIANCIIIRCFRIISISGLKRNSVFMIITMCGDSYI